ncbi:MAG: flippase-like domain-containing protein [Planctomycetota bacterium]|nr:flippase-like domain-containing protein [Planctomycetota bacterium]
MKKQGKKIVGTILKLLMAVGVLLFLYYKNDIDIGQLREVLYTGWRWIVLAWALFVITIVLTGVRWQLLLQAQGIEMPFMMAMRLTLIGQAFSMVFPGATGGDLVKAYYVYKMGKKRAAAVTTILVDRVIGLYCMIGMASGMVLMESARLWAIPMARPLVYSIPLVFVAITFVLGSFFTTTVRKIFTSAGESGPPVLMGEQLYKVYIAVDQYREARKTIVYAILISIVSISSICILFVCLGQALLEKKMTMPDYFLVTPTSMVITGLPIFPGGLGLGEFAMGKLFEMVADSSSGQEAMILWRIVTMAWSVIGLVIYLTLRADVRDVAMEKEVEERMDATFDYNGDELHDYSGAIHFHTTYSDGSEAIEKVISQGGESGLDFMVVTDHDTMESRADGHQGWKNGVLSIVGVEISPPSGHCLAVRLKDCNGMREMTPPEYLVKVREQNGLSFIAHPTAPKRPEFFYKIDGWNYWDNEDFDGLEIWSYMHDWLRNASRMSLIHHLFNPSRGIEGPDPALLEHWDRLGQQRRVIGIGGIDNHARNLPFRHLPLYVFKVLPFRYAFKTVRTHVLADHFTGEDEPDVNRVHDALQHGHCYIAYDYLTSATGFSFSGKQRDTTFLMGDEVTLNGGMTLKVSSPRQAEIVLLRNGEPIQKESSMGFSFDIDEPGVYRIEARLNGNPWVFTNPIYVRA